MKKNEFLLELKERLVGLPETDMKQSLDYYTEMIDDRMEDGLSEEEAVAAIGDLDEIVRQILTETPHPPATVKKEQKNQKRGLEVWMIVLLVLGALLDVWGLAAGIALLVVLLVTTKPILGKGYLYPLYPFNGKALGRILVRQPIDKDNS